MIFAFVTAGYVTGADTLSDCGDISVMFEECCGVGGFGFVFEGVESFSFAK